MSELRRKAKVSERNYKKKMKEFAYGALEIASLAQEVVKRRMERALKAEDELDKLMAYLLQCAEIAEDKGAAKSILSRFEAIKVEDLSKVMTVLKSSYDQSSLDSEKAEDRDKDGDISKLRFEDMYG